MTFEQARKFLSQCVRYELRDHYFGDREVVWKTAEHGEDVADGYFGGGENVVYIMEDAVDFDRKVFTGHEARELSRCGRIVHINRNDTTGPDYYEGS